MAHFSDTHHHDDRAIALWLIVIAMLIYAMVILGGVTRLTGSGLSMVDWKPVMGVLPPFTEQEWQETFAKYKQFPEYQKKNIGMDLEQFKGIFVFEYSHRVLGRFIGLAFLVPFLFSFSGNVFARNSCPNSLSCLYWVVCRVCLAGTWSKVVWSTTLTSANTGSPPT